jgi:outer membrane protein
MKIGFLIILYLFQFSLFSQNEYALQDCIDLSLKNHKLQISEKSNLEKNLVNQQFGKWSFLPRISVSPDYSVSFGRKLDPFTNLYNANVAYFNKYEATSQLILFQGFKYFKESEYYKTEIKNSNINIERIQEKIKTQIIEKCISIWKIQVKIDQQLNIIDHLKTFKKRQIELVNEGRLSAIDTLETSINTKNQTVIYLNLKKELNFETINLNYLIGLPLLNETKLEKFTSSFNKMELNLDEYYQIEDLKNKMELLTLQYKIDRTQLLPSLSLNGNFGTGYYTVSNVTKTPFSEQFNHNAYQGIGFYLTVPIFNKGDWFKKQKLYTISVAEQSQLIELKALEIDKRKLEFSSQKKSLEEIIDLQKQILKDKETIYQMNQLIYLEGKTRLSEVEKVQNEYYSHLNTIQDLEIELIKMNMMKLN